jgi:geranylgeranyl reductase family protein
MSNKNYDYDVIIAGGGPAGSSAGYILTKQGFNVLIIDRATFPRPKLCGGLLSLKSLSLLNAIFEDNIQPSKNNSPINYCTDHYEINYKAERIISKKKTDLTFCFVDRKVFDNYLLERAKGIGTKVIEGEAVKSVDFSKCEIITSNGNKFSSNFIIGADGVNSAVRREFINKGLIDKKKWRYDMATGLECYVNRKDLKDDWFDHPVLYFGFINCGYAWMFPNKDRLVLGLGGLNRKNKGNFNDSLKRFTIALKINPNLTYSMKGHPIPFGNFKITPVYKDNIFLIGDAGGFVDPLFGEGIYYAFETGLFAALSIYRKIKRTGNARSCFLTHLNKYVYPELRGATTLQTISYNPINVILKYYLIGTIIKLFEPQFVELIHGFRSFRWFKKKKDKPENLYSTLFK